MKYHEMMELGGELDAQFERLVRNCRISGAIDQGLYQKYDVKRGLRDSGGKGVLTGLTEISDVLATRQDENGDSYPIDGELYFRGINVTDLIAGNAKQRFMFEEATYLLLFGRLPGEEEPWADQPAPTPRQGAVMALLLGTIAVVVWGVGARSWGVGEIASAFLVLGVLCGVSAGFGGSRICASLVAGCRKMVPGALTIGMAAALRLALVRGGILDSVVYGLLQLVEGLPAWGQLLGMFYANALLDLLITSGSGHGAVAMPLMVPLADALSLSRQSAVLAFQLGDGLVNLVSPISNTLVSCLALSGVSYPRWLRYFLPLVGLYLAIGTAFLLLAGAVGY